jgi:hypothetical protein
MNALIQVAREASPYLAVELLLPGGSVIALLLWLFRHRSKKGAGALRKISAMYSGRSPAASPLPPHS